MTDIEDSPMFCFQCEQTAKGIACTTRGVCTKDPEVAALQDHLMYGLMSLGVFANRAVKAGIAIPHEVDYFTAEATFATLTNVNFEPADFVNFIAKAAKLRDEMKALVGPQSDLPEVASWKPAADKAGLVKQAKDYQINKRFARLGKDRVCLQELLVYGIKGLAAYAYHAMELDGKLAEVLKFVYRAYAFIHEEHDPSVPALLGLCLDCGAANLLAMEQLDAVNTGHFGHPVPTKVTWVKDPAEAPVAGKAILISGHDLGALETLLEQIEASGGGVSVYTHGEMLPANGYPKLHAHKALAGHYGTAWQNQRKEFDVFPGPVLLTTNCYMPAPPSYLNRVWSLEPVDGVGVNRANPKDFSKLIAAAKAEPGFKVACENPPHSLTVGFARNTVIGAAGTVLGAVEKGELKRIVLIGGCDGWEKERNYYTELAERLPKETLILTLACGKFKINGRDYGTLGSTGLPRLLDMGQCNDSYSAIQVALALAKALGTSDVNALPLSIVLSWFEQKAVAVLLTLLHLGIKNIYVGPRVPAFFTPAILQTLVEKFQLHVVGDPDKDLEAIMSQK